MNGMEFVREALAPFCGYSLYEGQAAVATHCLYPSNGAVTVYVSGGPNGARVSDEGGAIDTLVAHNRTVPDPDRFLKRFCVHGLASLNGKIVSPPVPAEQLTSAVILVANASSSAAGWGMEHLKIKRRRNLRAELHAALSRRFPPEQIEREHRLIGKSSRQYRFDNIVHLNGERLLVVDAVHPDPNSVNAHAIAHMDLGQRGDKRLIQRIVYDDTEKWGAAELNLLQMAATLVPFSGLEAGLERVSS